MISRDDVKKLAGLARINVTDTEADTLAKDMENILGYVQQIQEVSATMPGEQVGPVRNVFRLDDTPHESGVHTEAILAEAPGRQGDYVKVKKILH